MTKKIMWDKGHGGTDPGAVGNGLQEKELTHKIVEYAMNYMNDNYTDFEQRTTRTGDQTVSLNSRDDEADKWGADVFVSAHINSGGGTGFETFIYNGGVSAATIAFQNILHQEIYNAMRPFGNITDRGKKRANFAVLRETNMPAVLTESLFIDTSDSRHLKNEAFIKAIGEAHARGVAKFLGIPSKQKPVAPKPVANNPSVVYEAHVESIGWQGAKKDGQTAGTTGKSKRLEALTVKLENTDAKLEMKAHIQDKGWTAVRTNGEVIGTIGESLRIEAISINCDKHDIAYRVHVEGSGWTNWMKNGEVAGTTGQSKRIEAIEIKLG
jgi:N-acetylmuramoyl-L-alanine amidase